MDAWDRGRVTPRKAADSIGCLDGQRLSLSTKQTFDKWNRCYKTWSYLGEDIKVAATPGVTHLT